MTVRPQDVVGALDQQTSEIRVASLGDAELRIAFAGLAAFWTEPKIAAYVPAAPESCPVAKRQNEGKRGDVTDSMDRHHGLGLAILGLGHALDLAIILLDLESHLRDLSENWTERQLESWRHRGLPSLGEALRGRSRHTMAAGLRQATYGVHRRGSQPYQELWSADQRKSCLAGSP